MRWWAAALVIGGRHLAASSASESDGWRRRRSAISWSFAGSASRSSRRIASSWRWAALTRALHVRLVGVREPVCLRARRGDDRVLVEPERGLARAREREQVGDRLAATSRRRPRGRAARATPQLDALARGDAGEQLRARRGSLARSSRCGARGPESEPPPSSAPRR